MKMNATSAKFVITTGGFRTITAVIDGVEITGIPENAPGNIHWDAVQRMVDGGGVIKGAVVIAPSTDPADYPLNSFQFFTFLEQIGLSEATVDAAIESVEPDAMKRIEHKSRFRHAAIYNRSNPLLVSLVSAVGKTAKQIDTAWMQAKDLK